MKLGGFFLGLQDLPCIVDGDLQIDHETPPTLVNIIETGASLRGRKVVSVLNIGAKLLSAGDVALICGLHVILTSTYESGIIHFSLKRRLVFPLQEDHQKCNQYYCITLFQGKTNI